MMPNQTLRLLAIFILFFVANIAFGETTRTLERTKSPNKRYVTTLFNHNNGDGKVLRLFDRELKTTITLAETGRYLDYWWSPDSRVVVVIDHWDPNFQNLKIY